MNFQFGFTWHDARVVAFHVVIAAIQAALLQLKLENFGNYTPIIAVAIQTASEAVRRLVV